MTLTKGCEMVDDDGTVFPGMFLEMHAALDDQREKRVPKWMLRRALKTIEALEQKLEKATVPESEAAD